jgi:hypothetical protein
MTQNPVVREHRVGSGPTSGTRESPRTPNNSVEPEEAPTIESEPGGSNPPSGQEFVDLAGVLLLHTRQHVRVDVERVGDFRMA